MRPICRRNQQWLTGKQAAAAANGGGDAMDAIMRRAGNLSGGEQTVIELCAAVKMQLSFLYSFFAGSLCAANENRALTWNVNVMHRRQ